jgi:hypothetical protein
MTAKFRPWRSRDQKPSMHAKNSFTRSKFIYWVEKKYLKDGFKTKTTMKTSTATQ